MGATNNSNIIKPSFCISFISLDIPSSQYLIFSVAFGLLIPITIASNSILLYTLHKTEQLKTLSNKLIAMLTMSDLCAGAIVLPAITITFGRKMHGLKSCLVDRSVNYLASVTTFFSFLMLVWICIDRYLQVTKLTRYNLYMNRLRMWMLVLVSFFMVISVSTTGVLFHSFILIVVQAILDLPAMVFMIMLYVRLLKRLEMQRMKLQTRRWKNRLKTGNTSPNVNKTSSNKIQIAAGRFERRSSSGKIIVGNESEMVALNSREAEPIRGFSMVRTDSVITAPANTNDTEGPSSQEGETTERFSIKKMGAGGSKKNWVSQFTTASGKGSDPKAPYNHDAESPQRFSLIKMAAGRWKKNLGGSNTTALRNANDTVARNVTNKQPPRRFSVLPVPSTSFKTDLESSETSDGIQLRNINSKEARHETDTEPLRRLDMMSTHSASSKTDIEGSRTSGSIAVRNNEGGEALSNIDNKPPKRWSMAEIDTQRSIEGSQSSNSQGTTPQRNNNTIALNVIDPERDRQRDRQNTYRQLAAVRSIKILLITICLTQGPFHITSIFWTYYKYWIKVEPSLGLNYIQFCSLYLVMVNSCVNSCLIIYGNSKSRRFVRSLFKRNRVSPLDGQP